MMNGDGRDWGRTPRSRPDRGSIRRLRRESWKAFMKRCCETRAPGPGGGDDDGPGPRSLHLLFRVARAADADAGFALFARTCSRRRQRPPADVRAGRDSRLGWEGAGRMAGEVGVARDSMALSRLSQTAIVAGDLV